MANYTRFTGKNTINNFYARDFRNNYRFRPDVNPPRQQFQGYVNFIFNRKVLQLLANENLTFKTSMSSLVRSAQLPAVDYQVVEKNQYNKKRLVTTGVSFNPIDIRVFDTINNEWITILMKYFAYLYMNPRNKNRLGDRDVEFITPANEELNGSSSGSEGAIFNSNEAGLNLQFDQNFFERVDIILYAGSKGIQYSLSKPMITAFGGTSIDYSSSDFLEFNLSLNYENFTMYDIANFDLGEVDLDRFENLGDFNIAGEQTIKPLALDGNETDFQFLGNKSGLNLGQFGAGQRGRTEQPQQQDKGFLDGLGDKLGDLIGGGAGDFLGGVLDDALNTIAVKPTYGDREDKIKNDLIDRAASGIANAITRPSGDGGS